MNIEYFKDLKKAVDHKEKIDLVLESVKKIHYSEMRDFICMEGSNYRGLKHVCHLIGGERLDQIVEQFKGLIQVELHRHKELAEHELSAFSISVNKTLT